ncbi:SGNH/GDSL hydrolase family protein [Gordonia sp. zg691]|uniref:SGNH/GDSL hydrolase family protein n=1 Tax=Gordonia jinghuaiqii TaxID=2758710 RepID=A0A7D7QHS2_9ACTN|nr:SGNH/GDSL hydrolase family protein [Gordonia jinghuaiqii]MBD0863792.1 SGNH/GDSL hydrolase family protein [Gordonia jinghuaiqii]MCR5979987.1 SGNH/GDSL hydrolase family protein [Gordonia jinghuaiqii]QMT03182.1 SGNH/GDSL hydrolase family protein [Gordonia jinghuaiqii]
MGFTRFVAVGDSFTEGVGDPDPTRPNGLRGWADRVAEQLAAAHDGSGGEFTYANLAIRGRLLDEVIAEQVDAAVALEPDLITVYAGGNDLMRPTLDLDALIARYDAMLGELVATGATVVVFTAYDTGWAPVFRMLRGRIAIYNELLRAVAERHGALVCDFWRMRGYDDYRMWDTDRLHMSTLGHTRMAAQVLDVLGVDHDITTEVLAEAAAATRRQQRRQNAEWARTFLGPWVMRRVRGVSSGDGLTPRWPEPIAAADLRQRAFAAAGPDANVLTEAPRDTLGVRPV